MLKRLLKTIQAVLHVKELNVQIKMKLRSTSSIKRKTMKILKCKME